MDYDEAMIDRREPLGGTVAAPSREEAAWLVWVEQAAPGMDAEEAAEVAYFHGYREGYEAGLQAAQEPPEEPPTCSVCDGFGHPNGPCPVEG